MLWLGQKHGHLLDWTTQRWVQLTGQRIRLRNAPWLAGPVGNTRKIGCEFFHALADKEGLQVRRGSGSGILPHLALLNTSGLDAAKIDVRVRAFYERTAAYELDAWSEWYGLFRPFGRLLACLFSRRLQQLNVPLSPLDTSRGLTSEVIQLVEPSTNEIRYTAWVRAMVGTGDVLYAGAYGLCRIPGHPGPCVKVVFPLPNGNAIVIMRPSVDEAGSLSLTSAGHRFGDPGFYFTVQAASGEVWARHLPQMREHIHVSPAADGLRADHILTLWNLTFLRLHYRMRGQPVA
jgi:hypothetical protein